ncbi:hypothetical protein Salat_1644700 [Sesamum alatum]|uniref:Uncharacterized protein n=1 Tax=Sesamum alatum TaxID=300844 RepID=A0AAE1Y7I4_9LAMI|nr:hypothetical protein Salat_1644700 [Sesamum alatum]
MPVRKEGSLKKGTKKARGIKRSKECRLNGEANQEEPQENYAQNHEASDVREHTEQRPTDASNIQGLLEEVAEMGARAALQWAHFQRENDPARASHTDPSTEAGSIAAVEPHRRHNLDQETRKKIRELSCCRKNSGSCANNLSRKPPV